jgi:hypothetical protein
VAPFCSAALVYFYSALDNRYAQAVAASDRTLELAPDDINALNSKGNALQSWGNLAAKLSRDAEAEDRYERRSKNRPRSAA